MANKKNKKVGTNHIALSYKADKVRSTIITVVIGAVFIAALVVAFVFYKWWAFICALVSPVALYISIKYTIAVYKRGVDLTGDIVEFEPEYRYFVKFNRRELAKIYIKDPKTNKECETSARYRNKEIIFVLKNKEKYGYALPYFTQKDFEALKKLLLD